MKSVFCCYLFICSKLFYIFFFVQVLFVISDKLRFSIPKTRFNMVFQRVFAYKFTFCRTLFLRILRKYQNGCIYMLNHHFHLLNRFYIPIQCIKTPASIFLLHWMEILHQPKTRSNLKSETSPHNFLVYKFDFKNVMLSIKIIKN